MASPSPKRRRVVSFEEEIPDLYESSDEDVNIREDFTSTQVTSTSEDESVASSGSNTSLMDQDFFLGKDGTKWIDSRNANITNDDSMFIENKPRLTEKSLQFSYGYVIVLSSNLICTHQLNNQVTGKLVRKKLLRGTNFPWNFGMGESIFEKEFWSAPTNIL